MAAKKQKKVSANAKVGIGVGLTAAAVAAAGAYFLTGSKNAKDNRKKVKSWMLKAKADVLENLEKAEQMTEAEFNQLVMSVSNTYSELKDASNADIADFKREMKAHWPNIVKEGKVIAETVSKVAKTKPKAKPKAKKVAKKAGKKAVKKSTKKAAAKKTKK